jgi:hypothetical protein
MAAYTSSSVAPAARRAEQAVLGELQPLAQGHLADADVVLLGSGEVDERGAEAVGLHHAEVHLDALAVADRALGVALLKDLADVGQRGEGVHYRAGMIGGDQQVDVTDRLAAPADGAGQGNLLHVARAPQGLHQAAPDRQRARHVHQRDDPGRNLLRRRSMSRT